MNKKPGKTTTKTSQKSTAKLRIIAGEWRSRQLPIPDIEGLRPTPDRVRETLFNWINHFVPGAQCADLFCGSGALGLEALSRGAKSALFVDNSKVVTRQMQINLDTLKAQNATVIQQNTKDFLMAATPIPMDLIFLDPPFRKDWMSQIVPLLDRGWLADHAMVYIEMEKEAMLPSLPEHWTLLKEKAAGQLVYRLFEINKHH
ncbi:16S rRNA (guanine(966)-N(2))-methyltransferase RsmD [Marinomonas spartinae]|uniref:16S rRNA (guanine(966)-N(2))-methyltransferase RsmD n=1 Tax=Marinomonas spartinae TaxID=1792290 RepID=UPI0018F1B0AE|nr:16S rRNA (guanine(966)-N(2))-methyltransferase RsmD [Marinomonas spartinae]MBJ7556064.1 16S rRNA (guanine(966)-N(2))-methyltransferase RsmD [Marinomonas spartinae]